MRKLFEVPPDVWECVQMMAGECDLTAEDVLLACILNGLGISALGGASERLMEHIARVATLYGAQGRLGRVIEIRP